MSRFDAAQEAFTEGANNHKKSKKKLKSAKAKIKSLEQKVASLEQELKLAKKASEADKAPAGPLDSTATTADKPKRGTKSTGARRGRPKKSVATASDSSASDDSASANGQSDNGTDTTDYNENVSAEELAQAVSDAPDTVSEAAAEKTSDDTKSSPKPRRGRPRKTEGAAKAARKSGSPKKAGKGRRGRPSTKPPASPLTKISGVGVTMATRFEEAGVTTVEQFSKLSDDDMKEVLQKCGPRYRSADAARMEGYREAAREAMDA